MTVALAGGLVGTTELMARYRDAPFEAIRAPSSFVYEAVNAFAAAIALWVIHVFGWTFGVEDGDPTKLQVWQWIVAAFGSMALFRSSLFTIRLGDTDVAVGPLSILQTILNVSDREVDRLRAEKRSEAVKNAMSIVESFEQIKNALPTHCMALMQNVSAEEEKDLRQVVNSIDQLPIDERTKILNLGLVLINIVGADVLHTAVKNIVDTDNYQN